MSSQDSDQSYDGYHSSTTESSIGTPELPDIGCLRYNKNVPPKDSDEDFTHALYVPPWTDPDWEDEGPVRNESKWPIKSALLDRVRPAMLAVDQVRNPTPYAQRWGMFPGRVDGRSRTSPTRSTSRQIAIDGTVQTGKSVFDELGQSVLGQHGRDLDEYMTSERPNLQNLDENEQGYVRAYQELIIDEHWQGILFGNLTMDELIAGNHFTMRDVALNLDTPIHPLYQRSRWGDTDEDGNNKRHPRVLYNLDGERFEFNPRNNDTVWNAIQPALRLASHMISTHEPFVEALRDATNRMPINPALRNKFDITPQPKFKFSRQFNDRDPSYPPAIANVRNDPDIDPRGLNEQAMMDYFELRIYSSRRDLRSGEFVKNGPLAHTIFDVFERTGKFCVRLAAEMIWPLLTDRFSSSEKMMASYILAVTLVHETMHTFQFANLLWVTYPKKAGIIDPRVLNLINGLCQVSLPPAHDDIEPYFEEDTFDEVGHAYEEHVLGTGSWPLYDSCATGMQPGLLEGYGIVACQRHWSYGIGWLRRLTQPRTMPRSFNHLSKIDHVQRYFRREFWAVNVQKYGMAAWREPPKEPSLCCYSAERDKGVTALFFDDSNASTKENRKWLRSFLQRLKDRGKQSLVAYVRALIADSYRFDLTMCRFVKDAPGWFDTFVTSQKTALALRLAITELRARWLMAYGNPQNPQVPRALSAEYRKWVQYSSIDTSVMDEHSRRCIGSIENFLNGCKLSNAVLERRVVGYLIDLAVRLDDEIRHQESMIVDLYALPTVYWSRYLQMVPGHQQTWMMHVNRLAAQVKNIITEMAPPVGMSLPWWPEWDARLRAYATKLQTIHQLLSVGGHANPPNWRTMLITIPLLRQTHRKGWEQLYFIAKKEMLSLDGEALKDFQEFKARFQDEFALGAHKVVLPAGDRDMQGLAQLWAGVLDDHIEQRKTGQELNQIFNLERVRQLTQELEDEKMRAEAAQRARAGVGAEEPTASVPLSQLAKAQHGQAPPNPPQATRPYMESHPMILSGLQLPAPRFGEASQPETPTTNSPRHGLAPDAFSLYTSSPSTFPTAAQGGSAPWAAPSNTAQLAAQIHQPFGNMSTVPKPTLLPHAYAIRTTTTTDLQRLAADKVPPPPGPTSFPGQAPREAPPPIIFGGIGAGGLGDIDYKWAVQSKAEELAEALDQQRLEKENAKELAFAYVQAGDRAAEERSIRRFEKLLESGEIQFIEESDQDAEGEDVDMVFANAVRAIVDSDSEGSSESSETTSFGPREGSSGVDSGSVASSQGSKRRFSLTESGLERREDRREFMEWWQSRAGKRTKRSPSP